MPLSSFCRKLLKNWIGISRSFGNNSNLFSHVINKKQPLRSPANVKRDAGGRRIVLLKEKFDIRHAMLLKISGQHCLDLIIRNA